MREITLVARRGEEEKRKKGEFFFFSSFDKRKIAYFVLAFLLFGAVLIAVGDGAVAISPLEIWAILFNKIGIAFPVSFSAQQESVLLAIRLPRVLLGVLVGASLAVSGTLLQGLFRNPLAEPSLLGISSGAAFFAVGAIVLGEKIFEHFFVEHKMFMLPVAAFVGGICTIFLVYRIGKGRGKIDTATILLAGIAVNALAGAGIGFFTFIATDAQLRNITFWSLGSLGGATWQSLGTVAPLIILPMFWLRNLSRQMNALLLGDAEAVHLGLNVEKIKRKIILIVGLIVGAGVAVTGIVGFVGLVVPHLLRLIVGADHRNLLPMSAIFGAGLLVASDWLCRTIVAPAELPIGILTACIGAPFFLWLLLKAK